MPWRAVGVYSPDAAFGPNAHYCRVASTWAGLRQHQRRVLDHAQQVGAHVIKVLAYQQALGPGASDYRALDQLVEMAAERDLRILWVLEAHAGECTAHTGHSLSRAWYAGGWRFPYDGQPLGLRDHAERLAQRYADQPMVLGYQLVDGAPADLQGQPLQNLHSELARVIRVRAPHQLLVSAVAMAPGAGPQAVAAWRTANAVSLLDVLSLDDLEHPEQALPPPLMSAAVIARILGRPLWVGAAGVPRDGWFPQQRAQLMVNKVGAAAHIGLSGYFHYSGHSHMPEAQAWRIDLGEPLARTLPHLAVTDWAAVPGCQPPLSCPMDPLRAAEPMGVR